MKTLLSLFLSFLAFTSNANLITGFLLETDDDLEILDIQPLRVEYTMTERGTHSDSFPNEIREFVFWGEDSVNFAIGTNNLNEPLTVGETYPSHPLWNLYTPNEDGSNGLWFHNGNVGPYTGSTVQIGSFSVLELELDDFGEVSSIAVNFTQLNEDSTVTSGAMRYNSTVAFDAAVPESGSASLIILAFLLLSRRLRVS